MGDGQKNLDIAKIVEPRREAGVLPSRKSLKEILRMAMDLGNFSWSSRWDARCKLHGGGPGFNTVDAVNVIRRGSIVRIPQFDVPRRAWRIEIADSVEGFTFVVDLALDCDSDFIESPRVELVTAFFRRGPSREVDEWREGT
jgi:hypothetical protein